MKKNKTIIFLISVFILLIGVFVLMLTKDQKNDKQDEPQKRPEKVMHENQSNSENTGNSENSLGVEDEEGITSPRRNAKVGSVGNDLSPKPPVNSNPNGNGAIQKPIPYNFRMQEQNFFNWNPKIAESGVKTIITVDNYSGKKPKTFDVTGKSSLNVVTKDSNYDGVECLITLTIQGDPGFKITGVNQLSETISCSGNNN